MNKDNVYYYDLKEAIDDVEKSIAEHKERLIGYNALTKQHTEDIFEANLCIEKIRKNIIIENKFANIEQDCDAISEAESDIFDIISNLMDAHGNWAGKEVLTRLLDSLEENGYYY